MNQNVMIKYSDFTIDKYLNNEYQINQLMSHGPGFPTYQVYYAVCNSMNEFGLNKSKKQKIINKLNADLLELNKTSPLTEKELSMLAYQHFDIAVSLIEAKIISPNLIHVSNELVASHHAGVPLLHHYTSKKQIEKLVELGVDINIKSQTQYNKGLTLFEIATQKQQTGLLKVLEQFMDNSTLNNRVNVEHHKKVETLQKEKDYKKQFKLIINAIKENNIQVLDEILNHLDHYKKSLTYDGGHVEKNLLHYAVQYNQMEYVKSFIDLALFNPKYKKCYTCYGVDKNSKEAALYCVDKGYFNEVDMNEKLAATFSNVENKTYPELARSLIEKNIPVSLLGYVRRGLYKELENNHAKIQEIDSLKETDDFWTMSAVSKIPGLSYYITRLKTEYGYFDKVISKNELKSIFSLLKVMEKINHPVFPQAFSTFLENINKNNKEELLMLTKFGMDTFPEKEKVFIDNIEDDKIKAVFQKRLMENTLNFEDIELPKKKMKI